MSTCTPALIYFILAMISIMISINTDVSAATTVVHLIFILLWTVLLKFLCSSGYTLVAWILLLLPFILFILVLLLSYEVSLVNSNNNNNNNSLVGQSSVYKK